MKTILSLIVVAALTGCYATVGDGRGPQEEAAFTLSLPEVLPPLVVVHPGISVARDLDEEVFYSDGYYWARRDQRWYRSHDHRRGWSRVELSIVPGPIAQSPPGRYRHYRGE